MFALGLLLIAILVSTSQPGLCVVLVDSLRPDHLGYYGYERDSTPAVDAFAVGAVLFDQAISRARGRRDFVADLLVKPADGKDLPADGKDRPTETR